MQAATLHVAPETPANRTEGRAKPRSDAKPARRPSSKRKAAVAPVRDSLCRWAHGYVYGAGAVSAGLNGLAFSHAAPSGLTWAAWGLGILIPCGVLALGRVASLLYLRGNDRLCRTLAIAVAAVAAALLLLSVWHCTESVALLTGSPLPLAAALAVGVDAGMMGCEVSATLAGRRK